MELQRSANTDDFQRKIKHKVGSRRFEVGGLQILLTAYCLLAYS